MIDILTSQKYQFTRFKLLYHRRQMERYINDVTVYPIVYELSLCGNCNSNCVYCACKNFKSDEMLSLNAIERVIDEISYIGKAISITGGGEPSLNPHLLHSIQYARKRKLSIGLITNGVNITCDNLLEIEQSVKFIRLSIDSSNMETYCRLRGSSELAYHKLFDTIQEYMSISKRAQTNTIFGIHIVWVDQSEADIEETVAYFAEQKVDFIQIRPVDNIAYENSGPSPVEFSSEIEFLNHLIHKYSTSDTQIIPNVNKFEDYVNKIITKPYNGCRGANFTASIGHDNKVYFCCSHIGDPAFEIGDLSHSSLLDILRSNKRKYLIQNVDHKDCQFQCRNHHLNKELMMFDQFSMEQKVRILDDLQLEEIPFHHEFL